MIGEFTDSKFYGETESEDCPQKTNIGTFCYKGRKGGLLAGVHVVGTSAIMHSPKPVMLPHWNSHTIAQGAWGGKNIFRNLEFHNFSAKTREG